MLYRKGAQQYNNDDYREYMCQSSVRIQRSISIGNHMISSAIWDKSARVNFSKAWASAICGL